MSVNSNENPPMRSAGFERRRVGTARKPTELYARFTTDRPFSSTNDARVPIGAPGCVT
jgi:hypothetical protein